MAYIDENKVSTKEFIQNSFNFLKILGTQWRLLMVGLLLGACYSLTNDFFAEKVNNYRGTIIFKLEVEGGQGQMGGLGGLANAFGMGGAAVTGGDLFSAQNFPAIVQSQTVFERALMKEVELNGKKDLLVNYVLDSSNITTNEWSGTLFRKAFTEAINHRFEKKLPKDFTPLENLMMRDIYAKLADATSIYPMDESTMVVLSTLLTNEKLAKLWVDELLEATQDFYVEVKTSKTRQLLKVQQARLDSLGGLLYSTDRKLARITFDSQNIVDPSGSMRQAQVTRSNTFLSQQYLTQLATIEGLNRTILEQTPLFLKVEETRFPLEQEATRTGMGLKLSSLAGLLIMTFIAVVRWMYNEIMNT